MNKADLTILQQRYDTDFEQTIKPAFGAVDIVADNIETIETIAESINNGSLENINQNITLIQNASQNAQIASTKANEASASATTATTKANEASASATTATTKANEASASATTATTKANEASASATTATTKANEASASATTATTKANEASASATTATTKANEASASATTATTKANEASASATTATTKANEASASATTATTKANEASDSADEALSNKNKAYKWANENEDIAIENGEYSAKHWATKAQELVSNGILDDGLPSSVKTYSSEKIESSFESKSENIQEHISSTENPHAVTKAQVGLENADNTSDADKPISIAVANKLALIEGVFENATHIAEIVVPANTNKALVNPITFDTLTVGDNSTIKFI